MGDWLVKSVLIVGGGTAGWMTAAALANKLSGCGIKITLIESEQIGTVGVGEATVPHIRFFNEALGIDEAEFMLQTKATFKLGIEFRNWGRIGDSYIHPFGAFGHDIGGVDFLQHWLRLHHRGLAAPFEQYSLPVQAARLDRFSRPADDPTSIHSTYSYAYQFDAGLYGRFLRDYAEGRGVQRVEGKIVDIALDPQSGSMTTVTLDSGERLAADLFIDCSGFRGLVIDKVSSRPFEDWSHWLPCDRAIAIPCKRSGPTTPYTRSTALQSGWLWRIPLQHRVGNGHVYASAFIDDAEAERQLLDQLEGEPLADPNRLRFTAGKRPEQWAANCVAIGLSAGFLEPLESTSIHLIQLGITKLLELFPAGGVTDIDRYEYNRSMNLEYDRVRDFLILHYKLTQRDDSEFWNYCRTMKVPASLAEKIELFAERGVVARYREGMFLEPSWLAVYLGQNLLPRRFSPLASKTMEPVLAGKFEVTAQACLDAASGMPTHDDYLRTIGAAC